MDDKFNQVKIQVRIADIDGLNHVNNAVYLTFFELGRTNFFLKNIGIFDPEDVDFVVKHADIEFKKPIHFLDNPIVKTWISKIGNTSVVFSHEIFDEKNHNIYASGATVAVWVGKDGRKRAIPDSIREKITELLVTS